LRQTYGRAGEKPKSISRITAAQIDAYWAEIFVRPKVMSD
jgi:hypothetical protein